MKLVKIEVESYTLVEGGEQTSGVRIVNTFFVPTPHPVEQEDIAKMYEFFREMQERLYPATEKKGARKPRKRMKSEAPPLRRRKKNPTRKMPKDAIV